jgi:hypothetical protein
VPAVLDAAALPDLGVAAPEVRTRDVDDGAGCADRALTPPRCASAVLRTPGEPDRVSALSDGREVDEGEERCGQYGGTEVSVPASASSDSSPTSDPSPWSAIVVRSAWAGAPLPGVGVDTPLAADASPVRAVDIPAEAPASVGVSGSVVPAVAGRGVVPPVMTAPRSSDGSAALVVRCGYGRPTPMWNSSSSSYDS